MGARVGWIVELVVAGWIEVSVNPSPDSSLISGSFERIGACSSEGFSVLLDPSGSIKSLIETRSGFALRGSLIFEFEHPIRSIEAQKNELQAQADLNEIEYGLIFIVCSLNRMGATMYSTPNGA